MNYIQISLIYSLENLDLTKLNFNYFLNNLVLGKRIITYFPCSYNCNKSFEFAKSILDLFDKEEKNQIIKSLKTSILAWSEEKVLIFNNLSKNNEISYIPSNLLFRNIGKKFETMIKKGNKLKVSEKIFLFIIIRA